MSQKELADKVEITEASLSRYENNLREPKAEIVAKLAKALDTSTDFLILGKTENHNYNRKTNIITKAYHNLDVNGLPEEAIKQVEDYIEFIKQKYNPDGTLKRKD